MIDWVRMEFAKLLPSTWAVFRISRRAGADQLMSDGSRSLLRLIAYLCMFSVAGAFAAAQTEVPSEEVLDAQIERVTNSQTLSETDRAAIAEVLRLAKTRRVSADAQRRRAEEYALAVSQASVERAALEAQIERFKPQGLPKSLSRAPFSDLERRVALEESELASLRRLLSQTDSDLRKEQSYDAQAQLEKARATSAVPGDVSVGESEIAQDALATFAAVTEFWRSARTDALEQRLLSRPARLAEWTARQKLLGLRIADRESRLASLRAMIAQHRQSNAMRTVMDAQSSLEELSDSAESVRRVADSILRRAREYEKVVSNHDGAVIEGEYVASELLGLEQKYSNLSEQLSVAQVEPSPALGEALRRQRDQLADIAQYRDMLADNERALSTSRIAQFQIETDTLEGQAARITPDEDLSEQEVEQIRNLNDELDSVLETLSTAYASYIETLTALNGESRELIAKSSEYATLLDRHLLWMPTAQPLGLDALSRLGETVLLLTAPHTWRGTLQDLWANVVEKRVWLGVAALALLLLLRQRSVLLERLALMHSRVGRVYRDSIRLTFEALASTVLLALPGPLVMYVIAHLLQSSREASAALSQALTYGAFVYLVLELVLQSLRANGLAELHFKWPQATVRSLKRNLPGLMVVFVPAMVLTVFAETFGSAEIRNGLGRLLFVGTTILLVFFAYRILNPEHGVLQFAKSEVMSKDASWQLRFVLFPLSVVLPLLIAVLALLGYHHTAVQLDISLLYSVLVFLSATLIYFVVRHWLEIGERRLALERVRAVQAAAAAASEEEEAAQSAGEGLPSELEFQEIDMQTIGSHTQTLLQLGVTVGVIAALWGVWSGVFPAFQALQDMHLWDVIEIVDGTPVNDPVTAWDLLLALTLVVVTFLASKNIPGLLEIVWLSRFNMEPGTGYAITTITRYVFIITGTIVVLQLLGAQWSKVQWLVAALTVGLGFGLQEIVANFVSGIVLLFERPIRIGDTVTVGDQLGTVSRIRIRATTIVDWDRREIVIPNKTFITERLMNWTLSDPITRITIRVGVAYGSDVKLTESLLNSIARSNEKVLEDPPPVALFLNFGDNSLDFELRVFIRGIMERVAVTHELHVEIDKVFREHDVVIAFPQRDLHFDAKPIEIQLVDGKPDEKT